MASSDLLCQKIVKRVKYYVLINIDESSGYRPDDEIEVLRQFSDNKIKTIGKVRIVKYAKGMCAAVIIIKHRKYTIEVGDFIKMPPVKKIQDNYETTVSSGSGELGSMGVEKGDSEISFMGFYAEMIGTELETGGTGAIKLSYGYFVTKNLQVGAAPQLLIYQGMLGATYKIFSFSAFASYNFLTSSRFVPYFSVKWYQNEVAPGESDFMDHAYFNLGAGFRNFFNEYAALNTSISYGFNLGGLERTVLTIMSGVSIIF